MTKEEQRIWGIWCTDTYEGYVQYWRLRQSGPCAVWIGTYEEAAVESKAIGLSDVRGEPRVLPADLRLKALRAEWLASHP